MQERNVVALPRESAWRTWMKQLGDRARRLRELLGMSQDQLARLAGVSQGAVSRLEMGRGLSTPLVVALKIHAGLAVRLGDVDPGLLTDGAREFLAQIRSLSLPVHASSSANGRSFSLLAMAEFEDIIRSCSRVPDDRRRVFVAVMTALADALCKQATAERG